MRFDLRSERRVARPQPYDVPDAREMNRECGAPASGSEYSDGRNMPPYFAESCSPCHGRTKNQAPRTKDEYSSLPHVSDRPLTESMFRAGDEASHVRTMTDEDHEHGDRGAAGENER